MPRLPRVPLATLLLAQALAAVLALRPTSARANELRTGYQLGAAESAGTTVSNSRDLLPGPVVVGGAEAPPRASSITRFQGFQLTTALTGNVTFDLRTRTVDQALLLGAGFSQVLPALVPTGTFGTISGRISTVQGSAQYLARLTRESWGIAFGGGYALAGNGRLGTNPDGSVAPGTPQGPVVPGTQVTAFVINGLSHAVNARAELQLAKNRWDLLFLTTYNYTLAGIFSLAPRGALIAPGSLTPGDPAASQNPPQVLGANGTNLGAFTRATTHLISPSLSYRHDVGERGLLTASAYSAIILPVTVEDLKIGSGSNAVTFPAPVILPDTALTTGSLGYMYRTIRDRMLGGRVLATYGARVKTDPLTQAPARSAPLSPDALIIGARALYGETLPWQLRVDLEVGAAQPYLFQAPLGLVPFNATFESIHAGWTPVYSLTAQRKFDPINVSLSVARDLGPGATGAVAFANESVSLAGNYFFRAGGHSGRATIGFSFAQRHGYGRDQFQPQPEPAAPRCDPRTLPIGQRCPAFVNPALFFDNRALGANAALAMRLYRDGDFAVDASAAYTVSWLDPDVQGLQPNLDGTVGRPPSLTHFALLTIRGTFGRGPLENIEQRDADALSAYSLDPARGSPLVSSRLLQQGAPLLESARGERPGVPSRREYERQRREAETNIETPRGEAVRGSSTIQDEEAEAQRREAEEREERRKRRTHKFSEWPMRPDLPDADKDQDQDQDEKPNGKGEKPSPSADEPKP